MLAIFLYWFAAQQAPSTFKRQKIGSYYLNSVQERMRKEQKVTEKLKKEQKMLEGKKSAKISKTQFVVTLFMITFSSKIIFNEVFFMVILVCFS